MRIRLCCFVMGVLLVAPWQIVAAGAPQNMPPLKPSSAFRFDRYVVDYPASYSPQPLNPRDPGGFFTSTAPFGFMFVVMSRRGEDTVIPQGRGLANAMLDRLGRANRIVSDSTTDIPADQLPPRTTLGKSLDAKTQQGLQMHAKFFLMFIDDRKVLVGYVTLEMANIRGDMRHLITPYPDEVKQDFEAMIASLRRA